MTMQASRQKNFPNTTLRREGSANTLRLRVLMEEQQRVEIGQRIRELRETSPHTNESIAEHVGVGVRSVANWISGTTGITYANAKKVAELFEVDVRWLWDGKARPDDTDLLGKLSEKSESAQLSALRERVSDLGDQLAAFRAELLSELAEIRSAQEGQQKRQVRGKRSSGESDS